MKLRSLVALGAVGAAALATAGNANAAVLATWTFETSVPATAGPHAAEVGSGSALGVVGPSAVYSNPVGPASNESFSSTFWDIGDYWQFTTSTTGYQDVTVSFDAMGSNTGPKDFKIAYSTDGTIFTEFSTYSLINASWSSTPSFVNPAAAHFSFDLSAISALDEKPTIYFRLIDTSITSINNGTVATAGTSRVDNFAIAAVATPEPAAIGLLGVGAVSLIARRRRSI